MARSFYKAACPLQRYYGEWVSLGKHDTSSIQSPGSSMGPRAHARETMTKPNPVWISRRAENHCISPIFLARALNGPSLWSQQVSNIKVSSEASCCSHALSKHS